MKIIHAVIILLILCVPVMSYVIDSDEKRADYYRVGVLNWQNEGTYQNRHPALYVNINQCHDGEKNKFMLSEIQPEYVVNLPRPEERTYYSVVKLNEIDNLREGDYVVLKFSYNKAIGRHWVVDIFEMGGV